MEATSKAGGVRADLNRFRTEMKEQSARKLTQTTARDNERSRARVKKQLESRLQLKRAAYYLSADYLSSLPPPSQGVDLSPSTLGDDANSVSEKILPVYFVCIDVEAYEHDQKRITEIGISILDTGDLVGTSGGVGNLNWGEKIISKHFCISEHRHLRNKTFVQGCPANFEFGKSEYIMEVEAAATIKSCLQPPLNSRGGSSSVLVAHDVEADVKYLRSLGLDPLALVNDCIDTANLFRTLHRQSRSTGLGSMLLELGIAAKYLHNAGNDARYTLQALLTIAYFYTNKQKSATAWKEDLELRVQAAIMKAEAKVRDDFAGWESEDEEDVTLNNTLHKVLHTKSKQAVVPQFVRSPAPMGPWSTAALPRTRRRPVTAIRSAYLVTPTHSGGTLTPNARQPANHQVPWNRYSDSQTRPGNSGPPSTAPRGPGRGSERSSGSEMGMGRGRGSGLASGRPGSARGGGRAPFAAPVGYIETRRNLS